MDQKFGRTRGAYRSATKGWPVVKIARNAIYTPPQGSTYMWNTYYAMDMVLQLSNINQEMKRASPDPNSFCQVRNFLWKSGWRNLLPELSAYKSDCLLNVECIQDAMTGSACLYILTAKDQISSNPNPWIYRIICAPRSMGQWSTECFDITGKLSSSMDTIVRSCREDGRVLPFHNKRLISSRAHPQVTYTHTRAGVTFPSVISKVRQVEPVSSPHIRHGPVVVPAKETYL